MFIIGPVWLFFRVLYEPFGIVALEAMATNTPVVVSDVGGLSEIVADQITGLKVPAGSESALAEAIIKILSRSKSGRAIDAECLWMRSIRFTAGMRLPAPPGQFTKMSWLVPKSEERWAKSTIILIVLH